MIEKNSDREQTVINAMWLIAHTKLVDPDCFSRCVDLMKETYSSCKSGFGQLLEQDEAEFQNLLGHVKGCKSALEIGSRFGKSIERIAREMAPGSRVIAVDMPIALEDGQEDPTPILNQTMLGLAIAGYDATLFKGDSHNASLVQKVKALGPFDFCFIDGDHSYDGVKADWENYGPLARIVAFHDIINNVDCFRLWQEIKTAGYRTVEYTSSGWLGIGVVLKDQ